MFAALQKHTDAFVRRRLNIPQRDSRDLEQQQSRTNAMKSQTYYPNNSPWFLCHIFAEAFGIMEHNLSFFLLQKKKNPQTDCNSSIQGQRLNLSD